MPGRKIERGHYSLPIPVRRGLTKLGRDIRTARLRRRIKLSVLAQRAGISVPTLRNVERGDPGVSIGKVACVLFSLGMMDRLSELADVRNDDLGLMLEEEKLPERIREGSWRTKTEAQS